MVYQVNKKYIQKTKKKSGGGEWWEPAPNVKNYFRICPPWSKEGICIIRRVLHFGFEVDGRNRAFPCHEENDPWLPVQVCPTCHISQKMMMSGNEDEREAGKNLKAASARFVVQGVDCNAPDQGVQKYAGPISFGRYVLSLLEDEDLEDITDPEKGYDLIIEFSGKGRGRKYDYRIRPKPTPILYENWESELDNLIAVSEIKSPHEMIELLLEGYSIFDIEGHLKDFEYQGTITGKQEETITWDDLKKMKRKELLALVEEHDLDVEDEDWEDANELRECISEEIEAVPF